MSGSHRRRGTPERRRPRKRTPGKRVQKGNGALRVLTALSSVTIVGAAVALSQTDAYDRLGNLQARAESGAPDSVPSSKNQARISPGEELPLPPASRSKRVDEKGPARNPAVRVAEHGNGDMTVVPGSDDFSPSDTAGRRKVEYRVELEDGLPFSGAQVAAKVHRTLTDRRSWQDMKEVAFERSDDQSVDLRIILATPDTVDRLCAPLDTGGEVSCRVNDRVVLNAKRWALGVPYYKDVDGYRTYLVNHEVGHFLGEDHVDCEGAGEPAPVMMQQTKGIGACRANPYPIVR